VTAGLGRTSRRKGRLREEGRGEKGDRRVGVDGTGGGWRKDSKVERQWGDFKLKCYLGNGLLDEGVPEGGSVVELLRGWGTLVQDEDH